MPTAPRILVVSTPKPMAGHSTTPPPETPLHTHAILAQSLVGLNMNNLRYADDTTFMVISEEELKSLLMKVKEEGEKRWLKISHPKN